MTTDAVHPIERVRRPWLEDPRLSLEGLSPGQRYTAVLALALAIAMLTIGVPRGGSRSATTEQLSVPAAATSAGLVSSPAVSPPTTAYAPLATFPSAMEPTPTTAPAGPTYQPAPAPPPSSPSSTTTTTAPPASPLPIPAVTVP